MSQEWKIVNISWLNWEGHKREGMEDGNIRDQDLEEGEEGGAK